MTAHSVVVPVTDRCFPALLALPKPGHAAAPGLLFFHGSDGFGPQHARLASDFAEAGYAVLAPTWFGDSAPYSHWDGLLPDDLCGFWRYLQHRPEIDRDRLALAGGSRGGGLALIAASKLPAVRAVVNFFGLTRWEGELGLGEMVGLAIDGGKTLEFLGDVSAPIISFHGEADTVVPAEDTRRLAAACRRLGVRHRAHFYPRIGHSFIWHDNDKYHEPTRDDAWAKTLEFLARAMRPSRQRV